MLALVFETRSIAVAAVQVSGPRTVQLFEERWLVLQSRNVFRCLSLTAAACKDNKDVDNGANEGWLRKLLVRRIEPTKEQHSRMLSDKEVIYELQTHNVRPDSTDGYVKN